MSITSLSKDELKELLREENQVVAHSESVRILFAPTQFEEANPSDLTTLYRNICNEQYDTIVVVESFTGSLDKKLSIPSIDSFTTPYGTVKFNDQIRNELCDEEDDFFISDAGMNMDMSLFTQIMMYQACKDDFDVVSIQIGDYDTAIVKELASALDELFHNRNALLVFCCDIPSANIEEIDQLKALIVRNNESALHNYINGGKKKVVGARALIAGVIVARNWGLDIQFLDSSSQTKYISGLAKIPIAQLA